ncbi:MAG: hypothetical protein PHC84_04680 [Clostridia bacterium]|nr:hypothetical protein [Clostridia bacterium]
MIITLKTQSLFRLGVELNSYIDRDDLEKALKVTFKRYPSFEVELSQGFFRHYFVSNNRRPFVRADDGSLLKKIDFRQNKGYLLRVTYYKRKIFVDFFHGLCDGSSALEFFKTLIYYYLAERGEQLSADGVKTVDQPLNPEEFKDGFKENYQKFNFKKGMEKMTGGGAFQIKGTYFKREGFGLIQGTVDTKELLALTKKFGCSLTVLIAAIAMLSATKAHHKGSSKRNLIVFLPINLRRFYPSESIYNFTSFAKCSLNPDVVPRELESYISVIKEQLATQLEKKELDLKVSFTSLMDKKPLLKFMPLVIKSFFAKLVKNFTGSAKQTMIISNLGNVYMPGGADFIDNFTFMLNCGRKTPNNMGIVSYNNKTVISFTRQIVGTEIERQFFTTLSGMGLGVAVVSNMREV